MTSLIRSFGLVIVLTLTFVSLSKADAAVIVDTVEGRVGDFGRSEEIRRSIAVDIESGAFDRHHWKFPMQDSQSGRTLFTEVSSRTFSRLPVAMRTHIVQYLAAGDENLRAFRVSVDAAKNHLSAEPLIKALKIDVSRLGHAVPAEALLSDFARAWAYRLSPAASDANCYFTTIASLFDKFLAPRHMRAEEFVYDLKGYFTRVAAPVQWGDVIYLFKNDHAFVYLGRDRKDSNLALVFTKNGYHQSHFIFMSFADVVALYGANEAAYFRRNVSPVIAPNDEPLNLPLNRESVHDEVFDAPLERFMLQHPPERSSPFTVSKSQ